MRDTIRITHENTAFHRLLRKVVLEVSISLYKKIPYQILPPLLHSQNTLAVAHTPLSHRLNIPELIPCKERTMHPHLPANHDNEYQTHLQM